MRSSKVSVSGVSQPVLPELRRPLEELISHPHVQRVNPGKSFSRGGGVKGG